MSCQGCTRASFVHVLITQVLTVNYKNVDFYHVCLVTLMIKRTPQRGGGGGGGGSSLSLAGGVGTGA